MRQTGVKGIHIAERDTQRSKSPKPPEVFVNTWSVEGFLSEGMQPAELGWGTDEKWMPANAHTHDTGCGAAIYLMQPGANTRVRTWCPTRGAQYGFLVTHNELTPIAELIDTACDASGKVIHRPTCHYAYHPADDAVLSLHELAGAPWKTPGGMDQILDENEIVDGVDELGVLLYGHGKNAYWFGSAALDRGDAGAGALPERDGPAGDVRGARRHGVGAGAPGSRAWWKPTSWTSTACLEIQRPVPRCRVQVLLHRLDAADRTVGGPVPGGASTRATRGSSGTCWWVDRSHHTQRKRKGGHRTRLFLVPRHVDLFERSPQSAAAVGGWGPE